MALLAAATLVSLKLSRTWITCSGGLHAGLMCAHLSQRVQPRNTKTPGLLKPLQVPTRAWSSISCCSMDFIQLPVTRSGMDAIVVFVDRLIKMTRFAACTTTWSALSLLRKLHISFWRMCTALMACLRRWSLTGIRASLQLSQRRCTRHGHQAGYEHCSSPGMSPAFGPLESLFGEHRKQLC